MLLSPRLSRLASLSLLLTAQLIHCIPVSPGLVDAGLFRTVIRTSSARTALRRTGGQETLRLPQPQTGPTPPSSTMPSVNDEVERLAERYERRKKQRRDSYHRRLITKQLQKQSESEAPPLSGATTPSDPKEGLTSGSPPTIPRGRRRSEAKKLSDQRFNAARTAEDRAVRERLAVLAPGRFKFRKARTTTATGRSGGKSGEPTTVAKGGGGDTGFRSERESAMGHSLPQKSLGEASHREAAAHGLQSHFGLFPPMTRGKMLSVDEHAEPSTTAPRHHAQAPIRPTARRAQGPLELPLFTHSSSTSLPEAPRKTPLPFDLNQLPS